MGVFYRPKLAVVRFGKRADVPVFPGAQGFGTKTTGGRGGTTYFVDHLGDPANGDPSAGSWRAAAEAHDTRNVVFRVSGTINSVKPMVIDGDHMTVFGQTAPGDGICISGEETRIQASDIVIRHLRFRRGDLQAARDGYDNADALNIGSQKRRGDVQNVVLDHCSLSWAIDECVNTLFRCHDLTLSRCIFSESLYNSLHPEGPHSMGPNFGPFTTNISLHHGLIAHNNQRNYQAAGANLLDVRNMVFYNCGEHAVEYKSPEHRTNFVSNAMIHGRNSTGLASPGPTTISAMIAVDSTDIGMVIYPFGNSDPRLPLGDSIDLDQWLIIQLAGDGSQIPDEFRAAHLAGVPFDCPTVKTMRADQNVYDVLADCGATKPKRDSVDTRVCNDVLAGTGEIIDSQADVGGYPLLSTGTLPTDSDGDGVPDDFCEANGLNPRIPANATTIEPGQPYTWLERYSFTLAGDVA